MGRWASQLLKADSSLLVKYQGGDSIGYQGGDRTGPGFHLRAEKR